MVFIQIIFVVFVLLGLMMLSVRAQDKKPEEKPAVSSETMKSMSRGDIQRALKKIETNTAPLQKMGAMCYKVAMPAIHLEYICPFDGEKTMYSSESRAYGLVKEAQGIRGLVKELGSLVKGLSFFLDEKKLCSKCFPDLADPDRKMALVVKYADGTFVRTDGISSQDIRYLIGFFSGGLSYKTDNDGQEPLKTVEPRLKELLGEK